MIEDRSREKELPAPVCRTNFIGYRFQSPFLMPVSGGSSDRGFYLVGSEIFHTMTVCCTVEAFVPKFHLVQVPILFVSSITYVQRHTP